jgi:hypothetical protein
MDPKRKRFKQTSLLSMFATASATVTVTTSSETESEAHCQVQQQQEVKCTSIASGKFALE